jgi:hypothetical protein
MSSAANTFETIQPMLHAAYADGIVSGGPNDKKSRFKKLKSKLSKKDCECKPKSEEKCSCKKP